LTEVHQQYVQKQQELSQLQQQITRKIDDLRQSLLQQATLNIPAKTITEETQKNGQTDGRDSSKTNAEVQPKSDQDKGQITREQEINRSRENFGRTTLQDRRISTHPNSYPRRPNKFSNFGTVGFPRRRD